MTDIVTIPSGVTGPALQNTQVINAKWNNAQEWFERAFDFGEGIKGDVGTAAQIPLPSVSSTYMPVAAPTNLTFDNPNAALSVFDSKKDELSALIDDAFDKMVGIAFPDMTLLADAVKWCKRAINEGGTGINADVENALWERGRARILKQATRDTAGVTEKYARAGWPLPPGAMLNDIAMIRQDSRDKLAEQSRDIAIKSFDAELENVRFAITTAGDLFTKALQAVSDYVRTVMLAPQTAADVAKTISGLRNDAARTLVALYQAQNAAIEPFLRLQITDAELKERAQEANLRAQTETAQMRAQAALANLKMVGDAAAASLNGIGASVSNTMQTNVAM
ncbi:MAG: hypothetical protein HYX43_16160 [Burkholderiales bacterium]|nr:hypothetical protein [Burkholderiales bacterium]